MSLPWVVLFIVQQYFQHYELPTPQIMLQSECHQEKR